MNQRHTLLRRAIAPAILAASLFAAHSAAVAEGVLGPGVSGETSPAAVRVTDSPVTVMLENGLIALKINKANANVISLEYKGLNLVDGAGYWNAYGNSPGGPKTEQKSQALPLRITQDPATNGGSMGEIEIDMPYDEQPGREPLDIAIRYGLRQGDSGVYCWTSLTHKPGYPAFNIEISTVTLKLKSEIFDHLTIDSRRDTQMINADDWIHGKPLNLKETRLMTTGIHTGEVEHKYDYSAVLSQTPTWGWSSTTKHVGIWYVIPSLEFINGPPTKVELTGHIDLRDTLPADPTLLFIWHGSHYGGVPIYIGRDEAWNKVVGPFVIYCNSGPTPDAMWKDALARAAVEKKAWPYEWVRDPGYATRTERGGVTGRLVVNDPPQPKATAANAWLGLAAAPYLVLDTSGKPRSIGWELDGKHYEYWARAERDGTFAISNARPGTYVLYAMNDGILGDFSKADVTVQSGKMIDLGTLNWVPVRHGRQIWEIGTPDRSAAEFRHGDHYWTWGNYNEYPHEFPEGVNFVIGKSDWSKDWNYAQPPQRDPDGQWRGTTWTITFPKINVSKGKATLTLAICGSRGNSLDVSVNGTTVGSADLPNSGVMHRDGIRATETLQEFTFDASLLNRGQNHIGLTTHAKDWTDGVLYDYLRLEVQDSHVE